MKRFFQILAMAALSVSLWSCSKDAPADPIAPVQPKPQLTQLCLKGTITSMPLARVNADGFEANDKVGVYVAIASTLNSAGNTLDNEAFTYSSGNIAAPQGKEVYWASDNVRLSVFAYYPYVTGAPKTGVVNFSVEADQSTSAKYYGSDFISAKSLNLAPQSSPVALTFNHLLSRLDVELVAGDGITQDELRAAEKSLLVGGLDMSGKVDIVAGTVVGDEQFGDVAPYKVDGDSYSFIAYPCDEKLLFRLEMDDELYSCSADIELKAGYRSEITITVNKYEPQTLSLSVVGINPWTDDATDYAATMDNFITFADAKFKGYLIGENLFAYDIGTGSYVNTGNKIDANHDGEISFAEAEDVVYIGAINLGITSMAELHYFPNLEYLSCNRNQLTALDVSKNTALKSLSCVNNQLTALDVSKNIALESFWCYDNQLTALDVSKNTALKDLGCSYNQLTALDVSKNTSLEQLQCVYNPLTSLDVSKNTALEFLVCGYNQLTALDVSKNTALEDLQCYGNQLTALDVSNNTVLVKLNCGNNPLTTLDVSTNTALKDLHCYGNQLTSLDISKNTELRSLLCRHNQLTALDVSKNTALTNIDVDENGLTELDLSKNTELISFSCNTNELSSLNLSNNTKLSLLNCTYNDLVALDVSHNVALENLTCFNNQLTTLDVSKNTNLRTLGCNPMNDENGNNLLTTIYTYQGQTFESLDKPDGAQLTVKPAN